jgi:uncharacterized SAM-dependent methyltransferase
MVANPKAPKINNLIFKELIKRGYSLEGNTRVWNIADSKLWYLKPDQAQAYLDILDSEMYQSDFSPKEITLIKKHSEEIMAQMGDQPITLVDLGCGDGRKAVYFIEEFLKTKKGIRYYPIDISSYMVKKAIKTISELKVDEIIESGWNISDFENLENITPLLNSKKYKKNLFLLAGNTLSNFEFHDLLHQIRSSMKSGDQLIIGNGINNDKVDEDVVAFCKDNKLFSKFLTKIPVYLGIPEKNLEFDVRFVNSRIEFYHTLKEDVEVSFNDKSVHFNKGDQIIDAISYHYSKKDFISFMNLYFDDVMTKVSKDGSYALALCKK